MTTDLYRLVYWSRNRLRGTAAEVRTEIDAILASAQRNNSRNNVTGALIFNAGIFAQVLEGDRCGIESTFEKIQRDERHAAVQILALERVQARGFPTWSMAFLGRSLEGLNLFGNIGETTGYDAKRLAAGHIFQILCSLAIEEELPRREPRRLTDGPGMTPYPDAT